jgi:hypothetical protein
MPSELHRGGETVRLGFTSPDGRWAMSGHFQKTRTGEDCMNEEFGSQSNVLGTAQTGAPTEPAAGARLDTEGAVPTDFTGQESAAMRGETKGRFNAFLSRMSSSVRHDPWRAVLVGFLLGWAYGRGTRARMAVVREEYIVPPLHRAQGMLFGALLAVAAGCRSMLRLTAHRTHDALDSARMFSKPLAKATRRVTHRAQRRMHFGRTSFYRR